MARLVSLIVFNHKNPGLESRFVHFFFNFYNTIRNRRLGFFLRKYSINFVRACPVKECVGLTHFQTKEKNYNIHCYGHLGCTTCIVFHILYCVCTIAHVLGTALVHMHQRVTVLVLLIILSVHDVLVAAFTSMF